MTIGESWLASCVQFARIAGSRRAIDRKLSDLARHQTLFARTALNEDERHFRRSLIRNQYVLTDGTTGEWYMSRDLDSRLHARLEMLRRIEPARRGFVGQWQNAAGRVDIRRGDTGDYQVDANPIDIDFLGWSCEFDETLRRECETLILSHPKGDSVRVSHRSGVLAIAHRGDGSEYCGAGGPLSGIYFPIRSWPKPPTQLQGGPTP